MKFVIVDRAAEVSRNDREELNTSGVLGVVGGNNAYIVAYPKIETGSKHPHALEVWERSQAEFSLSGSSGLYDIVRVE